MQRTVAAAQAQGIDLDGCVNRFGETPLHICCFHGCEVSFLVALLDAGLSAYNDDPTTRQAWGGAEEDGGWGSGATPLMFAINQGRHQMVPPP